MRWTDALGPDDRQLQIIDAHTHTCGSEHDGPSEEVVTCLDSCGVEKAFLFALLLRHQGSELEVKHIENIRQNNDYIADFCSHAPDRLVAFAVLNPRPGIGDGDKQRHRGVGRSLLEASLEECSREFDVALLGTHIPGLYARFGFHVLPTVDAILQGGDSAGWHEVEELTPEDRQCYVQEYGRRRAPSSATSVTGRRGTAGSAPRAGGFSGARERTLTATGTWTNVEDGRPPSREGLCGKAGSECHSTDHSRSATHVLGRTYQRRAR